jgi:hypothetical protein
MGAGISFIFPWLAFNAFSVLKVLCSNLTVDNFICVRHA